MVVVRWRVANLVYIVRKFDGQYYVYIVHAVV